MVGQAYRTNIEFAIRPQGISHHSITHTTRVLHHHRWRAAESMVYKWSQLITISISVGCISVHNTTCFRVQGLRLEEPTTPSETTYRVSRSRSSIRHSNGSCANRGTNTLPRSTPKTTETAARAPLLGREKTLFFHFFFLDRRTLCACSLILFVSFSEQV